MAAVKVDSDSLEPPGPAPCVRSPHGTGRVLFPSLHTGRPRFAEVKGVFKVMSSPQLSPHLAWPWLSTAPPPEPTGSSWVRCFAISRSRRSSAGEQKCPLQTRYTSASSPEGSDQGGSRLAPAQTSLPPAGIAPGPLGRRWPCQRPAPTVSASELSQSVLALEHHPESPGPRTPPSDCHQTGGVTGEERRGTQPFLM